MMCVESILTTKKSLRPVGHLVTELRSKNKKWALTIPLCKSLFVYFVFVFLCFFQNIHSIWGVRSLHSVLNYCSIPVGIIKKAQGAIVQSLEGAKKELDDIVEECKIIQYI